MVFQTRRLQVPVALDLPRAARPAGGEGEVLRLLRERIEDGTLPAGARLPSSRQLAEQLGTSRAVVISAYARLSDERVVEGRGRLGTFVTARLGASASGDASTARQAAGAPLVVERIPATRSQATRAPAQNDWRPGQAPVHLLSLERWRQACREAGRHLPPQDWGDPQGSLTLRQAIVDYLGKVRSLRIGVDQVVVTRGSADALDVLARALLHPGDSCALEDPGHPCVERAFSRAGARLLSLPLDEEGVVLDAIEQAPVAPMLVHVTPGHQFPCGMRLSPSRRRALGQLARERRILIIENDYDAEFDAQGDRHPLLFSAHPEHTVLVGTFAKAISPSLRIGYLAAPVSVARAVARVIGTEGLQISWPAQTIVGTLLGSRDLDRHIARARRHAEDLRTEIRRRIGAFSDIVALDGDESGLHVVVRAHDRPIGDALQQQLAAHGIVFDAVGDYAMTLAHRGGIVLGYGHMDRDTIDQALQALEAALLALRRGAGG